MNSSSTEVNTKFELVDLFASQGFIVGVICILLVFSGIFTLRKIGPNSPLSPYILQILGLTFILPVVILITQIVDIQSDAVMGLLGTIVGYIFGTSQIQKASEQNQNNVTEEPTEPNENQVEQAS